MNPAPPRVEHPRETTTYQMRALPALPDTAPPKPPRLTSCPNLQDLAPRPAPTTNEPFPELATYGDNANNILSKAIDKTAPNYSSLDATTYIQMLDPPPCALFNTRNHQTRFHMTNSDETMCLSTLSDAAEMQPTAHRPRDTDRMPENVFQELLALISSKPSLDSIFTEPGEISIY
jgi:hypothetical protein